MSDLWFQTLNASPYTNRKQHQLGYIQAHALTENAWDC